MRPSISISTIVLVVGCTSTDRGPATDEILWDTWGVPHVYGTTEEAVFRGMGWAQMESHGDLILRLYGEARGRAAEYWGEEYLDSDRFMRTMGVATRGAEWLEGETPRMQANLDAFVEGMNTYAEQHPERLGDGVEIVLPVTASDILAHANRDVHFTFITNPAVIQQAEQALANTAQSVSYEVQHAGGKFGSNTWAIGPSRSGSGNAMLLANPHLPWEGLFLFYEQHLVGPGFDVYGTTLVGLPGVEIGFNDRLGWSHTVNTYDGADLFTLDLEGDGYRFGDELLEFETRTETVLVKEADGSLREDALTVRSSVHGPIVAEDGDRAVALRVAGLEQPGIVSQWWDMARAASLEEFEAALSRLQIPMFNVMYADADGHILYVFNGSVPKRSFGDVDTWLGTVDGSDPTTLWQSYHAYEELPRILDPEIGWLQNANDPPWTATIPQILAPTDFPAYLSPTRMSPRPQRSANILRADQSITFDEILTYKHDTRVELADRVLDDLISVVEASANARAKEAARVLAEWDRTVDARSRGALLFEEWLRRWMREPSHWSIQWSEDSPTDTPSGIADKGAAIGYLAQAADEVRSKYGALDTPWGDVHRARRGGYDVPVSGGPGFPHGLFRVAAFSENEDGTRTVRHGDSYYAVMEFAPEGVRARVLTAYGNASQPHSFHNGDQLELYARQEMRSVWRIRSEVEANTASRTDLKEGGGIEP